jgi:hypothetical protein
VGAAAVAAVACVVVAGAAGSGTSPPSAVARALPHGYRLLLTEVSDHGRLHVASYGGPGAAADPYDAPLSVQSFRGHRAAHVLDPQPGDRATTVRGHPAVMRKLTDEGRVYARELAWRERARLVVAVDGDLVVKRHALHRVAQGVRIVGQRRWARLYLQTSGPAQIGRVRRGMRRVRVAGGAVEDHRWSFFTLIPPHFPLSRDDRRVACFALRYRHHHGHGDNCGVTANWQRIGGQAFAFGAMPRSVKRVVVRPNTGHGFKLRARTVRVRRGPHVRYFALPLPAHACAVRITRARHPREEGIVAAPVHGRDWRRCARRPRPSAVASSAAAKKRPHCGAGGHTFAKNKHVRVFRTGSAGQYSAYACVLPHGRVRHLGDYEGDGSTEWSGPYGFVLAGHYVAYEDALCDKTDCTGSIKSLDVVTRRMSHRARIPSAEGSFHVLVVNSHGSIAWTREGRVWKCDAPQCVVLDKGSRDPYVNPNSLRLHGRRLSWTRSDGTARSARLN